MRQYGGFKSLKDRNEAVIKAIKDFKPTQEYLDNIVSFQEEFDAYMSLTVHLPECHCIRCIEEFQTRLDNEYESI